MMRSMASAAHGFGSFQDRANEIPETSADIRPLVSFEPEASQRTT
jgi:hypothetical protein